MLHTALSLPARVWRKAVVLAAAVVLLVATPALATLTVRALTTPAAAVVTDPGTYGIVPGTGTFITLTANNLMPAGGSRQLFYLSTTGTGIHRLPFRLHLFNQFYSNIAISSSGNVQPGVTSPAGDPIDVQECQPTDTFGANPSVLVLWGELVYSGGTANGVFVRTRGTAPYRTFTVSWQGFFAVSAPTTANAQVTFREDSQDITYTYGETTFQNLVTIGIQSSELLSWATRYCSSFGIYPTNGTRLTLRHFG